MTASQAPRPVISLDITITLIVSLLINSLAAAIGYVAFNNTYSWLSIVAIVVLIALGLFIQYLIFGRPAPLGLRGRLTLPAILTVIVVETLVIVFIVSSRHDPATGFVIDTTSASEGALDDLTTSARVIAATQPASSRLSMRVYGDSGDKDGTGQTCPQSTQIFSNTPYAKVDVEITNRMNGVKSHGDASLALAIRDAVKQDFKKQDGDKQLIVLTTGLNQVCDPTALQIFEELISEPHDRIRMVIFSIRAVSAQDNLVLTRLAQAFGGYFKESVNPRQIPQLANPPTGVNSGYAVGTNGR